MQDIDHIQSFTDTMAKFTAYFGKHLPDDVVEKLTELRKEQTSEISKIIYDAMFVDLWTKVAEAEFWIDSLQYNLKERFKWKNL